MNVFSDQNVFVDAVLLVRRHGEQATNVASERARFFRKIGDRKSTGRWNLIGQAVSEINRAEPHYGEWRH